MILDEIHAQIGSTRYRIAEIARVQVLEEVALSAWPLIFAGAIALAGLSLFSTTDDIAGWLVAMGSLLAATAVALSAKKHLCFLSFTDASGNDRRVASGSYGEMDQLRERVQHQIDAVGSFSTLKRRAS